jgi:hypothetical protein
MLIIIASMLCELLVLLTLDALDAVDDAPFMPMAPGGGGGGGMPSIPNSPEASALALLSRLPTLLVAVEMLAVRSLMDISFAPEPEWDRVLAAASVPEAESLKRFETISSTLGALDESCVDEVLLRVVCSMPSWLFCDISVCICDCIFSRLAVNAAVSSAELKLPSPSVSYSAMSAELTPSSEAETEPLESVSLEEMMLEASLLSISSILYIELVELDDELICIKKLLARPLHANVGGAKHQNALPNYG